MAEKKEVIKTIKRTTTSYTDSTVICDTKLFAADGTPDGGTKEITQDKGLRMKSDERKATEQVKETEYHYSDGSVLVNTKVYGFEDGQKTLKHELVKTIRNV